MNRPLRICVVGEWLHGLSDEGIHNLAQNLINQWVKEHQVFTIRIGKDLFVNRAFLSLKLRKLLQDIHPDLVFYISPSSSKIAALFRAKVLKVCVPRARVFVIASQPVPYTRFNRLLLPIFSPDGIFAQSWETKELLQGIRCPVYFLPSGVDLERFIPVEPGEKKALRQRYGFNEKDFVILHVGHIKKSRNVGLLSMLAELPETKILLVGSASTRQEEGLVRELEQQHVRVFREFVPCIEELYQLADIYFFPVVCQQAAIGVPLSVLEAMACNLPVITTRFGGLPQMFQVGHGFFYFDNEIDLLDVIQKAKDGLDWSTRQMVERFAWQNIACRMIEMVQREETPVWN